MAERMVLLVCVLLLATPTITSGKPAETTNANCRIIWLWGVPCDRIAVAIVTQIKASSSYKLGPVSPLLVQANHTSTVGQIEKIRFNMMPTSMGMGCHVEGTSVSAFWYSLFDNGTNYCNLHDIITGSGLSKAPGFEEFTNEWFCLGIGSSSCQ